MKVGDIVKHYNDITEVLTDYNGTILDESFDGRYIVDWGRYGIHSYKKDNLRLVEQEKPMSRPEIIMTPTAITIAYDGKLATISEGDYRYNAIIDAVKADELEKLPDLVDVAKSFEGLKGVDYSGGRVKLNGKEVPKVVSDRILKFKNEGLPFDSLVKFSEKLMENPSFNSRQMLYKFLEHNGHPITKDGNFIAYKKVDENFKDCYTHTIDNSVGATVEMDRDEVDDNPNNTCSSGLHVAAYNYAKGFSSGHLVLVEVDPKDVVSVPNDYNGEKMRVCKYVVKEVCESRLETEYYNDHVEDFYGDYVECGDEVVYDSETYVVDGIDPTRNRVTLEGHPDWVDGDEIELK